MAFLTLCLSLLTTIHYISSLPFSCSMILNDWTLEPSSFFNPSAKVKWNLSLANCTERVYIWYGWLDQSSQVTSLSAHGEATLQIVDRCQVISVSLGILNDQTQEIVYSPTKSTWLPALVSTVSTLSTVAVFSTTLDCRLEHYQLKICQDPAQIQNQECRFNDLSGNTETYISGLSPCTDLMFEVYYLPPSYTGDNQVSSNRPIPVWRSTSRTLVSLDIKLSLGLTTANISAYYRSSCKVHSTLWKVRFCKAVVSEANYNFDEDDNISYFNLSNDPDDEKDDCHEITVHPDQLQTTAIIDNLTPCTQYIIRVTSDISLDSEEKILTDQTLCH